MKTILVTAYAVNPYKGSEDGTGWNMILQIARFNKVIAVTRKNNKTSIEKFFAAGQYEHTANIRFEYFDLPYWMRFWKRKNKGALIYFYLWQLFMPLFIKYKKFQFDITHNLNFHSDWAPSFLWVLQKPFVWGPVGHHTKIRKEFLLPQYGWKSFFTDRIKWYTKILFWKIDPFVKLSAKKANTVIAINSSVKKKLHITGKTVIMPAVGTDDMYDGKQNSKTFRVISVGRFVPLKGFDICIKSFAIFKNKLPAHLQDKVCLTLVGKGPEQPKLMQLAIQNNLLNNIEWVEWVERKDLKNIYAAADVFFFPSHEGAGMVIPEALSNCLPVLCFNNDGPGELVNEQSAFRVNYESYNQAVAAFADKLEHLFYCPDEKNKMSTQARLLYLDKYSWEAKGEMLQKIYARIA